MKFVSKNCTLIVQYSLWTWGFPGGSVVKNPPTNIGDVGSIPGLGRSSGEGNGNPLQYSCLENSMDKGAWRATVHGVARFGHDQAIPGGSDGKASAYNAGDPGSIPGLGRSSGEGNGTPLQYSCLENPMGRGLWQATACRVAKSWA